MWGHNAVCALADEYEHCDKCPTLVASRSQVVFGSGKTNADLMVIGSFPGDAEDKHGAPFLGAAGMLLLDLFRLAWPETDEILDLDSIEKGDDEKFFGDLREHLDEHIFWTGIVMCHTEDNRPAATAEVKACKDRLHKTIYAVDPALIVVLGREALSAMLGKKTGIMDKHGLVFDVGITSPVTKRTVRYPVMATLHPNHLLKGGDQAFFDKKEGNYYHAYEDLRYAVFLLTQQYQTLWGTDFPNRPETS